VLSTIQDYAIGTAVAAIGLTPDVERESRGPTRDGRGRAAEQARDALAGAAGRADPDPSESWQWRLRSHVDPMTPLVQSPAEANVVLLSRPPELQYAIGQYGYWCGIFLRSTPDDASPEAIDFLTGARPGPLAGSVVA
jgi:hypothetical protein